MYMFLNLLYYTAQHFLWITHVHMFGADILPFVHHPSCTTQRVVYLIRPLVTCRLDYHWKEGVDHVFRCLICSTLSFHPALLYCVSSCDLDSLQPTRLVSMATVEPTAEEIHVVRTTRSALLYYCLCRHRTHSSLCGITSGNVYGNVFWFLPSPVYPAL